MCIQAKWEFSRLISDLMSTFTISLMSTFVNVCVRVEQQNQQPDWAVWWPKSLKAGSKNEHFVDSFQLQRCQLLWPPIYIRNFIMVQNLWCWQAVWVMTDWLNVFWVFKVKVIRICIQFALLRECHYAEGNTTKSPWLSNIWNYGSYLHGCGHSFL